MLWKVLYSLPTHAITPTNREWFKSQLVLFVETLVVSRIGLWQESLRMENTRFYPVIGIVLDVLQVDTKDVLDIIRQTIHSCSTCVEGDRKDEEDLLLQVPTRRPACSLLVGEP